MKTEKETLEFFGYRVTEETELAGSQLSWTIFVREDNPLWSTLGDVAGTVYILVVASLPAFRLMSKQVPHIFFRNSLPPCLTGASVEFGVCSALPACVFAF